MMMGKKTFVVDARDKELFERVVFLVEATSTEVFMLWKEWFHNPDPRHPHMKVATWEQDNPGTMLQIGTCSRRPVCVSVEYNIIEGKRVLFYHGCSQVVDHLMIEEWLQYWTLKKIRHDGGHRWSHCDAMNFHNCVHALRETAKK